MHFFIIAIPENFNYYAVIAAYVRVEGDLGCLLEIYEMDTSRHF